MKVIDFLEVIFPRSSDANSGKKAKERLQSVLAHDRATITPEVIERMRQEILDVVARYVDVDREEMEFGLENSQRITSLIANFPIRKVKGSRRDPFEALETLSDETLEL